MTTLFSCSVKQSILFSNHCSALAAAATVADSIRNSGSTGASDSHGVLPTVNYLEFLSAALRARSEEEACTGSGSACDVAVRGESRLSAVCLSASSSSTSSSNSSSTSSTTTFSSSSTSSTAPSSSPSSLSAPIQFLVSKKLDLFYEEILEFPRRLSGLCDHSADCGPKKFRTTGNVSVHALFISTAADIVHKNILRNLLPLDDCNGKLHRIFSEVKFEHIGRAVVVAWLYIVRALGAAVSHDVLQNMSAEELIFLAECSLDFLLKLHTQHEGHNTTPSSFRGSDKSDCRLLIGGKFSREMEGAVLSTLQRIMMIWSRENDGNCLSKSNNDINIDGSNDGYNHDDEDNYENNDKNCENDEMSHGLRNLRIAWILIGYVEYLMMTGVNKSKERGSIRVNDEKFLKVRDKGIHKRKDKNKDSEFGVGVRKDRRTSSRIMGERMDVDNEEKEKEEEEEKFNGKKCSLNLEHVQDMCTSHQSLLSPTENVSVVI